MTSIVRTATDGKSAGFDVMEADVDLPSPHRDTPGRE